MSEEVSHKDDSQNCSPVEKAFLRMQDNFKTVQYQNSCNQQQFSELEILNLGYKQKLAEIRQLSEVTQDLLANQAILLIDKSTCLKYFTTAIKNYINVQAQDIGRKLTDLTHVFLNVNLQQLIQKVLDSQTDVELNVQTIDEKWVLLKLELANIGQNKGINYISISLFDITDIEQNFQQAEKKYKNLKRTLQNGEVGVLQWNVTHGSISHDKVISQIFGFEDDSDSIEKYRFFEQYVHPEDKKMFEQNIQNTLESGIPLSIEYRILLKDKTVKYISLQAETYSSQNNGDKILSGICWDISNRMRKENQLISYNNDKFSMDDISDGWWHWDFNTQDKFISPKLKSALGYRDHEVPNSLHGWRSLIHADDFRSLLHAFEKYLATHKSDTFRKEIRFLHKDGSIVWMICQGRLSDGKSRLGQAPSRIVGTVTDITDFKHSEDRLKLQANCDSLTKLSNKAVFVVSLPQAVERAKRHKKRLSVFFIDLNEFKQVNDTFGHNIGDKLLVEVSSKLLALSRTTDLVARIGGDEFAVLAEDIESSEDIICIAKRYTQAFLQPLVIDGQEIAISLSLGIANYPSHGSSPDDLLKSADEAMYRAKASGKNQYVFYDDEINQVVKRKGNIEKYLQTAIANHELSLVYQPQTELESGKISGIEALIRWRNDVLGEVSPSEFIPVAEQSGLIISIGKWVIQQAFKDYKLLSESVGHSNIKLALNISRQQLEYCCFESFLNKSLDEFKLSPKSVIFELNENAFLHALDNSIQTIENLSALGVEFAIDNFGASGASLKHIQNYPISKLKIDRSFVCDIPENRHNLGMIKALISLANSIGIKVIAEGIETQKQYESIKKEKCIEAQGFYLSKPLIYKELIQSQLIN